MSFKLEEGLFKVDIMVKVFTVRLVKHWHKLCREIIHAPSLEAFRARLNGALSNKI